MVLAGLTARVLWDMEMLMVQRLLFLSQRMMSGDIGPLAGGGWGH